MKFSKRFGVFHSPAIHNRLRLRTFSFIMKHHFLFFVFCFLFLPFTARTAHHSESWYNFAFYITHTHTQKSSLPQTHFIYSLPIMPRHMKSNRIFVVAEEKLGRKMWRKTKERNIEKKTWRKYHLPSEPTFPDLPRRKPIHTHAHPHSLHICIYKIFSGFYLFILYTPNGRKWAESIKHFRIWKPNTHTKSTNGERNKKNVCRSLLILYYIEEFRNCLVLFYFIVMRYLLSIQMGFLAYQSVRIYSEHI